MNCFSSKSNNQTAFDGHSCIIGPTVQGMSSYRKQSETIDFHILETLLRHFWEDRRDLDRSMHIEAIYLQYPHLKELRDKWRLSETAITEYLNEICVEKQRAERDTDQVGYDSL